LQRGILSIVHRYFNAKNKGWVSGIRVLLRGKWTKTRSGRKQKLLITVGKLKAQTVNSFVDYSIQGVSTKFGACSVQVTIAYKKI
jgi:ribosomal protein S3